MTVKQISFYKKQQHAELKGLTCNILHNQVHVGLNGDLSLCCTAWMPWFVGNINETSILEYLKSAVHSDVINSGIDGSFSYCDHSVCPEIQSHLKTGTSKTLVKLEDFEPDPRMFLLLDYDKSCNLQCPSCRSKLIFFKDGNYPPHIIKTHENTLKSLDEILNTGQHVCMSITGSGDLFASKLYSDMMENYYHPSENYSFGIETNGILMTQRVLEWANMRERAKFFNISIDASTAETYSIVRKGGNFEKLKKNLDNFNLRLREGFFKLNPTFKTNFIVSTPNFREMADFAKWQISEYDQLTKVWFNCIADWFHLGQERFDELAVWKTTHPDHAEFLEVLKDPIFKHPKVALGNLSRFL